MVAASRRLPVARRGRGPPCDHRVQVLDGRMRLRVGPGPGTGSALGGFACPLAPRRRAGRITFGEGASASVRESRRCSGSSPGVAGHHAGGDVSKVHQCEAVIRRGSGRPGHGEKQAMPDAITLLKDDHTHPRPHSPDTPPGSILGALPVAAIDRAATPGPRRWPRPRGPCREGSDLADRLRRPASRLPGQSSPSPSVATSPLSERWPKGRRQQQTAPAGCPESRSSLVG